VTIDPFAGEGGGVAFGVIWDGTQWIAVGCDKHPSLNLPTTKTIRVSQDGKVWDSPFGLGGIDPFASETGGVAYAVAYNGTRYVFAGTNGGSLFYGGTAGTYTLATAEAYNLNDILPLTTSDPFGNGNAYGVGWNGQQWVVAGNNLGPGSTARPAPATAAVSSDGLTWETSDPFNGGIGYGVMWSGNEWVLSGTNVSPSALSMSADYTIVKGTDGVTWTHNSATDPFGKSFGNDDAANVAYTVGVRNQLAGVVIPKTSASGNVGEVQFSDGNGNFRGSTGLVYDGTSKLQGGSGSFIDFDSLGNLNVEGAGAVAYPTAGTLNVIGCTGGSGRMTIFVSGSAYQPTVGASLMYAANIPSFEVTAVNSTDNGTLLRIAFTTNAEIRPPGNYIDPVNLTNGEPTISPIPKFSYFVVGDTITDENDVSATIVDITGSADGNTEVISYEINGDAEGMFMSGTNITVTGSNTRALIQKNVGAGGINSNVDIENAGKVRFNVASQGSIEGLKTINGSSPFPIFTDVLLPGSAASEVGNEITKLVVPTQSSYFAVYANDIPTNTGKTVWTVTFNLSEFPIGGTFFAKNMHTMQPAFVNFTINGTDSQAAVSRVYGTGLELQSPPAQLHVSSGAGLPSDGFYLCVWDGQMLTIY